MPRKPIELRWLLLPMIFTTIGLGYFVQQSDFSLIFSMYAIFFACYFFIFLKIEKVYLQKYILQLLD